LATGGDLARAKKNLDAKASDALGGVTRLDSAVGALQTHMHAVSGASILDTHVCKPGDLMAGFVGVPDQQPVFMCAARGERAADAMAAAGYTADPTAGHWCVPFHGPNPEGTGMTELLACSTSARQAASFAPTLTSMILTHAMAESMTATAESIAESLAAAAAAA
jgi:hypothetical protein